MNFKPTKDRVLVRPIEDDQTTQSGIQLVTKQVKTQNTGLVLAVGPGRDGTKGVIPVAVQEGETVLYGAFAGQSVEIDGENLIVLAEHEIIGVLE